MGWYLRIVTNGQCRFSVFCPIYPLPLTLECFVYLLREQSPQSNRPCPLHCTDFGDIGTAASRTVRLGFVYRDSCISLLICVFCFAIISAACFCCVLCSLLYILPARIGLLKKIAFPSNNKSG